MFIIVWADAINCGVPTDDYIPTYDTETFGQASI